MNVALPTLRADLDVSDAGLQLVAAGYILAYAVFLITGARLGGIIGYRRAFLLGLAGFALTSAVCGVAPQTGTLIASRFLQGASAALMTPQVMSLIQRNFAGPALARALGYFAAVIAGGVVVGEAAGGLLVSADLFDTGWRAVFLVNVPIGLLLFVAAPRVLPRDEARHGPSLDAPGLFVLSATVLLFVLPLVLGHDLGWPAWAFASLAASVVLAVVFVVVERQVSAAGGRPLKRGVPDPRHGTPAGLGGRPAVATCHHRRPVAGRASRARRGRRGRGRQQRARGRAGAGAADPRRRAVR
ncbi:MFS transporter [Frankia sp. AgB32]|uniref:MFS transporter n=1 Tax=Frankia sp. AgB32 TaxID=631119 RepID=UPI00200BCBB2|nr:MFS transporter [Frankia sp. AgB32]MCK9893530.1 MFS transporter [Frankia sp. AgB32]